MTSKRVCILFHFLCRRDDDFYHNFLNSFSLKSHFTLFSEPFLNLLPDFYIILLGQMLSHKFHFPDTPLPAVRRIYESP